MTDVAGVLEAFYEATRCEAALWSQSADGAGVEIVASCPVGVVPRVVGDLPLGLDPAAVTTSRGPYLTACLPGSRRVWLGVGACWGADQRSRHLAFLLPVISQYLQSALEVEHAANELAERYEEINLLYTTSEILGRTLTLEDAASTILREISETVGARHGAILVHDRVTDTLQAVAMLGRPPEDAPPIAVTDETSVSSRVFRSRHLQVAEREELPCDAERPYRRGAMLSVPIMWTGPGGGEPLGVVNLSGRRSGQPFTAGDQKLVAAIATQIGTAIQNARLVRASLAQQKLVQEMQLAHDLQMKLLPKAGVVAPQAEVAARVVPAESVGGDFYHLFRLGQERTGVMIGDVSSHGYRAALIMALAMSASAIHAQITSEPEETLRAILTSLGEELTTTEMFITAFYGVIDRERGVLRYANTGHPHAFIMARDGTLERLPAIDPPLGMVDSPPHAATRDWKTGDDLLLLFTDGVSDARNRQGSRLGEQPVLDLVRDNRHEPVDRIVERVFDALRQHTGDVPLRDDLTLVVVRS